MDKITSAFDAWKARAATAPIGEVAARLKIELRRVTGGKGGPIEMAGACPRCGGRDRFAVNTRKNVFNCRHCGTGGHGAIDLAMFARSVGFLEACELITGEPPPDRASQLTDEDRERFEREARELAEREDRRAQDENMFREAERGRLREMWERAKPVAGTPAQACLQLRGLRAPPNMRARCILDMPYYAGGSDHGDVLAHAPARVLPIVDAGGTFRGLHFTYIDLARPKGKLLVLDPKSGDPLDSKKVRGSKKGNKVEILRCADPHTLIMGEGFEKTVAVWMALDALGRDLSTTAFWSACDLGNLAGKSAQSVRHPSLKTKAGRAQMVAGPDPDPDDVGIPIPESVKDLVLLGDSTSDRFTTQCAMYRASVRYAAPGRAVRVAWAPAGMDFDDLLREAA